MSIQKKSLISTLQSTKKANIAKETVTPEGTTKAAGLKASPVMRLAGKGAIAKASGKRMILAQKGSAIPKAVAKRLVLAQKAAHKNTLAAKASRK